LPTVLLLAVGCGSTAGKTAPGLQAATDPLHDVKAVSRGQISAVVRNKANQAALKSCYERALKMDNHLTRSRVDVTVSVGTSGAVQRVVTKAPSSFISVESCIQRAVKHWVFPRGAEEYAVNFPLIMQGGM
jgi:glutamine synthetase type III